MTDLFQPAVDAGDQPVECLGMTFPNDAARREHFLGLLREKLKDPEFRKIEGFPIGTDEDILALSDPPYYTACPNPFLADFIQHNGKPYDPNESYSREPYTADVSEGKYDPLYKLHPYHTKVPHRAIIRYILHYTDPGDLVFDGYCGTGMTGLAAQLCGDREVIESLGYKVEENGGIFAAEELEGQTKWVPFSKLGARQAILSDLSPAATFIAFNYNTPVSADEFETDGEDILSEVEQQCAWMYQTLHQPSPEELSASLQLILSSPRTDLRCISQTGRINYVVWSDVFSCAECGGELIFWQVAVDKKAGVVHDSFKCPYCDAAVTKRELDHIQVTRFDPILGRPITQSKQVPVLISYTVGSKRYQKEPDAVDCALIDCLEALAPESWSPSYELMHGFNTRQPIESHGFTHVHHFYTARNRIVLSEFNARCQSALIKSIISIVALRITKRYGLTFQAGVWGAGGGPTSGTLYIPSLAKELNMLDMLDAALAKSAARSNIKHRAALMTTEALFAFSAPDSSIDYIFLDPPFGSNIMYSEMNFLWESWLGVLTNTKKEAVVESKHQAKTLDDYRHLMKEGFAEAFRLLKPGRWITIEFSNTQASVWNAIQTALQEAGFVVANVAALDKQKGSFKALTTPTAVKQDLVISAYKPNGGLEERFVELKGTSDAAWDFIRNHLRRLPVLKVRTGNLEFLPERDPRILFDRMVAWFVRHNAPVPLSSPEFQEGLQQRFAERDGMIFLPEQVTEYDRRRLQAAEAPQMDLFVSDERSAIDWLTDFLKRRPSAYQDVHPEFLRQLGAGWRKHEARPELSALLEDNFLQFDGRGDVPSQIHSYLSTNFKDLRGLDKSDPRLAAKANNRWYVPDPTKAQDLEKKRERALLREFESYRAFTGRRLKEFRIEAMRAGFKHAWGNRDYATILAVAKKLPEDVLQEDEKLLLWYDQALTRTEAAD